MKRAACLLISIVLFSTLAIAQTRLYQKGVVTRMRIGECMANSGGILSLLAGQAGPAVAPSETCPEYTLISDRVVYVMVAKSSNELIPLADDLQFRFQKNEILVRVDDSTREVRFSVRAMSLRPDWELEQMERQLTKASTRIVHGESLR